MSWLRASSRHGILGQSRREAAITIGIALLTIATSLVYDALNHGPNRIFLRTPIDDLIPVVGVFAVPYVSLRPFVYGALVLFLVFRVNHFRSAALSMTVVFAVSYLFYVFLQSYIQRPEITGDDFFSQLIRDVYASDQPYNDFPSLHASLSTIMAVHWLRAAGRIGWPIAVWAGLIALSTVFVKQHYVADLAAGVALGWLVSRFMIGWLIDEDRGRAGSSQLAGVSSSAQRRM